MIKQTTKTSVGALALVLAFSLVIAALLTSPAFASEDALPHQPALADIAQLEAPFQSKPSSLSQINTASTSQVSETAQTNALAGEILLVSVLVLSLAGGAFYFTKRRLNRMR